MKLELVQAAEIRDLAARIEPVITAHETASFVGAIADAGCRYGQYRQMGRTHQEAIETVERIVHGRYGLPPWPTIHA